MEIWKIIEKIQNLTSNSSGFGDSFDGEVVCWVGSLNPWLRRGGSGKSFGLSLAGLFLCLDFLSMGLIRVFLIVGFFFTVSWFADVNGFDRSWESERATTSSVNVAVHRRWARKRKGRGEWRRINFFFLSFLNIWVKWVIQIYTNNIVGMNH